MSDHSEDLVRDLTTEMYAEVDRRNLQDEHERFFIGVVGFMRRDGQGLTDAFEKMREHVLGNFDEDEQFAGDAEFRADILRSLDENEDWMRSRVDQAIELADLAGQRRTL